MSIDPRSFTPVYLQLAAAMRDMIDTGEWAPGEMLPSEQELMEEYRIGRAAVRNAIKELRAEGLIRTERRVGSFVRDPDAGRTAVTLEHGTEVTGRMPTPAERDRFDLPEGVPVFVIERPGRAAEIVPTDRARLIVPER
jgi:DNA-binding GntR family transcriptional regulator